MRSGRVACGRAAVPEPQVHVEVGARLQCAMQEVRALGKMFLAQSITVQKVLQGEVHLPHDRMKQQRAVARGEEGAVRRDRHGEFEPRTALEELVELGVQEGFAEHVEVELAGQRGDLGGEAGKVVGGDEGGPVGCA